MPASPQALQDAPDHLLRTFLISQGFSESRYCYRFELVSHRANEFLIEEVTDRWVILTKKVFKFHVFLFRVCLPASSAH